MKWNVISLGDIALQKGGSVDPKKHPDEVFELYSIPAFDAGAPEVTPGSAIGSSKKAVQPDDVMISRIVPHIRRAWVVGQPNGHRQIASGEWIIFKDKSFWPQYLRWVLVGDVFHSAFMRTVSGVGGSLLRARPAEVFKIQIPLPPLTEQRRIAAILDAADALRAKRRESLVHLDTLLQSTFLDMFGDPVTNPMGWEQMPFTDVCDIQGGTQPPKSEWISDPREGYVRMLQIRDFTQPDRPKVEYVKDRKSLKKCTEDDILIGRYGASVGKILEGLCGAYNVAIAKCLWDQDRIARAYLLTWLRSQHFQKSVTSFGGRAAQAGFNKTDLGELQMSLPPLGLQHRFAAIVDSVEQQKAAQRAHLDALDTLFASLQSRAFRGDL